MCLCKKYNIIIFNNIGNIIYLITKTSNVAVKNWQTVIFKIDLENPLIECMWFELKTKLQNILINIIYRSERQSHHPWSLIDLSICIVSESTYWIESIIKIRSSNEACINFTNVILSVSEECIPRGEVTIRCNDKIWFDSNIRREIRKRDRFRRKYLRLKTALSQTIFKPIMFTNRSVNMHSIRVHILNRVRYQNRIKKWRATSAWIKLSRLVYCIDLILCILTDLLVNMMVFI
jgi:hypothetical protein